MNVDVPYQQPPSTIPSVPWGIRDIIFATILAAAGIITLNLAALGASLLLGIPLRENSIALVFFVILQDLVIVAVAWLFGVARYHVNWEHLGLRTFAVATGCTLSAFLLFASYLVRIIYGLFIYALGIRVQPQEILMRLDVQGSGFWITLVVVAILAPVAEELFFRGFVYGGLRRRIGVVGAMVASSAFFTALHLSIGLFIPILVLGLFLAWLYEYTGSLYPGMLLHAANNAFALIVLYLLQSTGQLPALGY